MTKNSKKEKNHDKNEEVGQFTVHIKLGEEYCQMLSDMAKQQRRTRTQMATVLLEISLEQEMEKNGIKP